MSEAPDIHAFQRLNERLTTSGALTPANVKTLASLGVRHVINLALDDHTEALRDEADLLMAQGIAYTHIPVPFDAPDDEHFAAFRAAFNRVAGPVHVHCIMNWRVSAFCYRYNREVTGMDEAQARKLMQQQWDPAISASPAAAAWAAFIGDA